MSRSEAAGLYADLAPFSDEERAKIRADLGVGYARFKSRVADGRGMTDEEVETIARGRVWTGEQALDLGLVDELGDLQAAAEKARDLAELDPRRRVALVNVPVPKRHQLPVSPSDDAGAWLAGLTGLLRERVFALCLPLRPKARGTEGGDFHRVRIRRKGLLYAIICLRIAWRGDSPPGLQPILHLVCAARHDESKSFSFGTRWRHV